MRAPGFAYFGQATQKRRWLDFNWIILAVIVAIIAVGLLNLRNADFYSDGTFHERQLKWYLLGMVIAIVVAVTDLHLILRMSYVAYGLCIIALIAVLFTEPINNSRRWITLPLLNERFQPSEFVKLALVMTLARWFHERGREKEPEGGRSPFKRFIMPFVPHLLMVIPVGLIFLEPDLGTALILLFIGMSQIFFEGVRWRSVLTAIGIVALIFPLAWKFALHDYHKDRVMVWWDAEALHQRCDQLEQAAATDPSLQADLKRCHETEEKAYQPEQAVVAIGSGQFYGKGGQQGSATRQKALPFLHTDFVIATYGEERGFIGCTLLLALYYLLVVWAIRVTRSARDRYQALLAVGVSATIFWQFFVNVGMVTGLLPVVGVALPLLSYGGSSVLSICLGLGLLYNIVLRQRATG